MSLLQIACGWLLLSLGRSGATDRADRRGSVEQSLEWLYVEVEEGDLLDVLSGQPV